VEAADHRNLIKDADGAAAHVLPVAGAPAVGDVDKDERPEYPEWAAHGAEQQPRQEAPPALAEHPARDEAGHDRPEEDD
jgi:hypothetical protein